MAHFIQYNVHFSIVYIWRKRENNNSNHVPRAYAKFSIFTNLFLLLFRSNWIVFVYPLCIDSGFFVYFMIIIKRKTIVNMNWLIVVLIAHTKRSENYSNNAKWSRFFSYSKWTPINIITILLYFNLTQTSNKDSIFYFQF